VTSRSCPPSSYADGTCTCRSAAVRDRPAFRLACSTPVACPRRSNARAPGSHPAPKACLAVRRGSHRAGTRGPQPALMAGWASSFATRG
jgi:hypothetical protein